jgi:hypothetical protein
MGNLSVAEIQNLLKNQKEDADTDWIAEIQELKVQSSPPRPLSHSSVEEYGC